jgi:hypothetical protein
MALIYVVETNRNPDERMFHVQLEFLSLLSKSKWRLAKELLNLLPPSIADAVKAVKSIADAKLSLPIVYAVKAPENPVEASQLVHYYAMGGLQALSGMRKSELQALSGMREMRSEAPGKLSVVKVDCSLNFEDEPSFQLMRLFDSKS